MGPAGRQPVLPARRFVEARPSPGGASTCGAVAPLLLDAHLHGCSFIDRTGTAARCATADRLAPRRGRPVPGSDQVDVCERWACAAVRRMDSGAAGDAAPSLMASQGCLGRQDLTPDRMRSMGEPRRMGPRGRGLRRWRQGEAGRNERMEREGCRRHIRHSGSGFCITKPAQAAERSAPVWPVKTSRRSRCPWYLRDSREAPPSACSFGGITGHGHVRVIHSPVSADCESSTGPERVWEIAPSASREAFGQHGHSPGFAGRCCQFHAIVTRELSRT